MDTSVEQLKDWMHHPEKYNIQNDDDFARFVAWIELQAVQLEKGVDPKKIKQPTYQQVIIKVNELRGRLID
jgi:hypothetical protein